MDSLSDTHLDLLISTLRLRVSTLEDQNDALREPAAPAPACCPPDSAPSLEVAYKEQGEICHCRGTDAYEVGHGSNSVIMIPDVWGWNSGRTRMLADTLASENGESAQYT
jgi:hypothetical protein